MMEDRFALCRAHDCCDRSGGTLAESFDRYFHRLTSMGARVALQTSGYRLTEQRAREVGLSVQFPPRFGAGRRESASKCTDPWRVAFIRWNGEFRPCCYAPSTIVMGDLNKQSFWDIWNGPSYRDLRLRVNTENPPDYCLSCTVGRMSGVDDERAHVVLAAPD